MSKRNKIKSINNIHFRNISIIIIISMLTTVFVYFATPTIFHSFIDRWDYQVYFNTLIKPFVTNGNLPYIDYNWEYPILMLAPVIISALPVILFKSQIWFFIIFPCLMIICNLVTTVCVYYISYNIYLSTKRAFIAAFLFATAFSTVYFVITKYDAFPTCLLMMGLAITICGKEHLKKYGYVSILFGFFAKIYPIAALPFFILFNSKTTSLKQEIISALKIAIPASIILALPILILNPGSVSVYLLKTEMDKSYYVNTLTYTIYSWVSGVFRINIGLDIISICIYIVSGLIIISLLYFAYTRPEKDSTMLLKSTLCILFAIVMCSKFKSPQYMMWFVPILCIFASDSLYNIGLFYMTQILAFLEFPILWGSLYTNNSYTSGEYMALIFFTIEFAVWVFLIYKIVYLDDRNVIKQTRH